MSEKLKFIIKVVPIPDLQKMLLDFEEDILRRKHLKPEKIKIEVAPEGLVFEMEYDPDFIKCVKCQFDHYLEEFSEMASGIAPPGHIKLEVIK